MQRLAVPSTIVGLKLLTCPSLPACTLNQKKKTIAMNNGQLAHTFIKLGDNLTNNDRDIHSLTSPTRRKTYSPFGNPAERANNALTGQWS